MNDLQRQADRAATELLAELIVPSDSYEWMHKLVAMAWLTGRNAGISEMAAAVKS